MYAYRAAILVISVPGADGGIEPGTPGCGPVGCSRISKIRGRVLTQIKLDLNPFRSNWMETLGGQCCRSTDQILPIGGSIDHVGPRQSLKSTLQGVCPWLESMSSRKITPKVRLIKAVNMVIVAFFSILAGHMLGNEESLVDP